MMLGHCFIYDDKNVGSVSTGNFRPRRIVPLEDRNTQEWNGAFYGQMNGRDGWGVNDYRYGNIFAELGLSAHYDSEGDKLLLGSPGTWNWTGTTIMCVCCFSRFLTKLFL